MPWDLFLKTFMNFQLLDEKARRQRSHTKGQIILSVDLFKFEANLFIREIQYLILSLMLTKKNVIDSIFNF